MKKFYFSALALFLGAGFMLNAQNATFMNPSFENWSGGTPDGWTLSTTQLVTGGGALSPASPITQETSNPDPTDGNSYIRLETFDLQNSSDPQHFPDGPTGAHTYQGFSSTEAYPEFTFDIQYDIGAGDTAIIFISGFGVNNQQIGNGTKLFTGTSSGWEHITLSMHYYEPVKTYELHISSSMTPLIGNATLTPTLGSWIAVDNFKAGEDEVSLTENTLNANVFPNPATNEVNFNGLENGTVAITSVVGQEIINTPINGDTKVDVSNINHGIYIYTIRNQEGEVVKTSKLVIE